MIPNDFVLKNKISSVESRNRSQLVANGLSEAVAFDMFRKLYVFTGSRFIFWEMLEYLYGFMVSKFILSVTLTVQWLCLD